MNYATLSPETRKAYIETCEKILKNDPISCSAELCQHCPASIANNGQKIPCDYVKGGSIHSTTDRPAVRAYFERTLKELKAMETKMTKEEAKKEIEKISSTIEWHNRDVNHLTKKLAYLQAIIDAPEVDQRVGKLFWYLSGGENTIFQVERITDNDDFIALGSIVLRDGRACRPVTKEEALAMVYEPEMVKSCTNCGNLTGYCIKRLPKVCDNWAPK